MKFKQLRLLGSIIVVFLLLGLFIFPRLNKPNKQKPDLDISPKIEQKIVSCTRTTRLDNKPQYDRALSLIQQRVYERNKWWDEYGKETNGRFDHFPPELVNCIKISEESTISSAGIEGYFTFNGKDIKTNYYPITVSNDYVYADDIVTALLLSHEMTHVQQYMDTLNGKNTLSCIDNEIEAFITQLDFYVLLNSEENKSVYDRIQSDKDLHSQLQMIKTMTTINRDAKCTYDKADPFGKACKDKNLRDKLREMLTKDSVYAKQCGL